MTAHPSLSHEVRGRCFALALLLPLLVLAIAPPGWSQVSITTEGYNNSHTNANLNELVLNTSNVNVSQFGKLFSYTVDGSVFAQPLYLPNVPILNKGTHNVLYVATMNDVVYAFDADSNAGANASPLWSVDFRNPAAGIGSFPSPGDIIAGNIGILSTPVIDPATSTMYLVVYALENGHPVYHLHALDVTNGAEKFGGPVVISASVPGTGPGSSAGTLAFDPAQQMQRPALALANGMVFIAFGAFGDLYTYHGWVMAYDAQTLQQSAVSCTTPNGNYGSLWMTGRGPVVDANNNVYFMTADGVYDGISNFGDSFVKYATTPGGFSLADWFAPDDFQLLYTNNEDLGLSGPMLIPETNLLVGGGKSHVIYVVNSGDLGHEQSGNGQIVQLFMINRASLGPAYYDRATGPGPWMYLWPFHDYLTAYHFNGTNFDTTPVSQSTIQAPSGAFAAALAVSANGSTPGTGIVWANMPAQPNGLGGAVSGVIRAFDASDLSKELWDSLQNPSRDDIGDWSKFRSPVVANGKLYMASVSNSVAVYGLLSATADFTVSASPGTSTAVSGGTANYTVQIGALSGFAGDVSLSVTGLPAGASASFVPPSVTASGSSALTVTLATNPPPSSVLTITAMSGSLSHAATVLLNLPGSVSPAPATVTLGPNQTQRFTASVQNLSSQSVTWSISPDVGTIDQSGLYISPSIISAAQTVTVTATSVSDSSKSGTATIHLTAGVGSGASVFLGLDTTTQGNWHGAYGADGYSLAQDAQALPSYGTFAVQNQINYTWSPSTSDPRALQNGANTGRIAATWYNPSSFSLQINFAPGSSHQVAIYLVDWDSKGRSEVVQTVDTATGIVLDTRSVSNFSNGIYLIWNVWGKVTINITNTGGPNSVVSGIFFGGAVGTSETASISPQSVTLTGGQSQQFNATVNGAAATQTVTWSISAVSPSSAAAGGFSPSTPGLYQAPATITTAAQVTVKATSADGTASATAMVNLSPPSSSTATFVSTDTSTQGNWQTKYGADGYSVANGPQNTALSYGSFAVQSQLNWTWASSTSDVRALQSDNQGHRIAATWYSPSAFSFDVNLTDGKPHPVALYALDWDVQGRAETLQVFDAATNALLDTEKLSNFSGGIYLVWNISGHVKITVTLTGGPNAVVSGIFFGGSGNIAPPATAAWVGSDTITQGHWIGKYGTAGYSLAQNAQVNPSYGTFSVQNQLNWTWATNPSDPRALEINNGAGTIAATWYSPSSFTLDVNLTGTSTHPVALYVLDWDSQGRAESIQVVDANSGTVLDTRLIPNSDTTSSTNTSTVGSNFVGGTYLLWNISGHVKINVVSKAGPNAVVSGIFFN